LSINNKYAAFTDIVDFSQQNSYKISKYVEAAYAKSSGKRSKFEKEIIKVDERVNIAYAVYKGDFFKIIPVGDTVTFKWETPMTAHEHGHASSDEEALYLQNIASLYLKSIKDSKNTSDWKQANDYLNSLIQYQKRKAGYELPSDNAIGMEIFYNNFNVFKKLFPFYGLIGFILIVYLIVIIIRVRKP